MKRRLIILAWRRMEKFTWFVLGYRSRLQTIAANHGIDTDDTEVIGDRGGGK